MGEAEVVQIYQSCLDIKDNLKLSITTFMFLLDMTVFVVVLLLNHVQLFSTLQTTACQAPLSVGFPKQEYWRGLPFPTPGDLPNPGIEPMSLPSMSLPSTTLAEAFFTTIDTGKQI